MQTTIKEETTTLTSSEKIEKISHHFHEIMLALGLDTNDDSLKDTPMRVAKMFVNEAFMGLNPLNEPSITVFKNTFKYNEMILEKDIPLYSYCEHHFVPIIGKAHVAYISKGEVIGLSKLNRITHYFSKRPQVQERLTIDIAEYLKKVLQIEDVAVIIKAEHLCVASRGINHTSCATVTSSMHGAFLNEKKSNQLYAMLAV